jgi:hypothetical protein
MSKDGILLTLVMSVKVRVVVKVMVLMDQEKLGW